MHDGRGGGGVGDGHQIVRPVGEVGETVVCGDDLVGVVLAFHRFRHRVVDQGDVAAGWKDAGQEARTERVTAGRVADHRERQSVRWWCLRVVGESYLLVVEGERPLGQADGSGRGGAVANSRI